MSIKEIYEKLNTTEDGLDNKTVTKLLNHYGKNILVEKNKRTKLQIFLSQFKNIMIILLLIVGFLSLIYSIATNSDYLEPIVILTTTLINCIMGFLQESKAEDAIGKLKNYTTNYITVKRNGKYIEIDSKKLVIGDYIILEAGDKIPADARVVKSYFAKVDESILTGESQNVDKNEKTITKEVTITERYNIIYSGTVLVSGKIEAIVIATGMNTELGKIAQVMDVKEEPITPLQMKVQKISKFITIVACILITFVLIFGIVNNYDFLTLVMLCISMIVASVPECLPIAITATLTIGVSQMAKKKSIVRNLAAIETLGATEIICTDKTGTLTENKMTVTKIFTDQEITDINKHYELINIMNYCNTATLDANKNYNGDSVDVALKNYLKSKNIKLPKYKEIMGGVIEHEGTVVSIEGRIVKVLIEQTSACAACHAKAMCNASESKEKIIEVEDHSGAYEVGEQVTVWGQTSLGMQAVLLAFVVPLFIILVALIAGTELHWSETATGLSGLLLLVPYYYIMYRMRGRLKKRFVFRLAKI